jgi:DNA-binding response OmpR family regulator
VSLGAKDYLAKPYSNVQLVARMARLTRHGKPAAARAGNPSAVELD